MATEVKLPQLGQTMEEGTIVGLKVSVGDKVARGDVICEVETDKATLEMESPAEGFVKHIAVKVGDTIPVADLVVILGAKDEDVPAPGAKQTAAPSAAAPQAQPAAAPATVPAGANVVKLPQLGQTMEEGTIVACKVSAGDKVVRGDVIFEVETDKATLEMESPAEGFVKFVLVETGQTIPVGDAVLILAGKDDDIPQSFADSVKAGADTSAPAQPAAAAAPATAAVPTSAAPPAKGGRIIASPKAKKLAAQLGVDLSTVSGTGPGGRISEEDVRGASSGGSTAKAQPLSDTPALGATVAVSRLQKITAQKMLQSKQEIPCFYLSVSVDMTDLVSYRAKVNKAGSVKIAYNDFIIKAVATAIEKFPIMAGQLAGDAIKIQDSVGVGLAMSVPGGLVAPIVKDAQKKTSVQIASDSGTLIAKAKDGKLAPTDLEGGCITISNLGAFGIDSFIPIVVPGQCSIIGIGKINDTCVPDGDKIATRKMMSMTLSVDHKVANGAYAAQFLDLTKKTLEDPTNIG